MKKILVTALVSIMMLFSTQAFAQLGIGGGYANLKLGGADVAKTLDGQKAWNGFYVGLDYNWKFSAELPGLSLDPGISYLYAAYNGDKGHYLRFPVKIKYTFDIAPDFKVAPYTGPAFNLGFAGKRFNKDSHAIKNWNAQWGVGTQVVFSDAVALDLGWDWGMSRQSKVSDDLKVRGNMFHIGLVFLINAY